MPSVRTERPHSSTLIGATFLLAALPALAAGQDVAGSADHPLISRFEGSAIIKHRSAELDEYRLVTGPINGYLDGDRALANDQVIDDRNSRKLEGRLTMITYEAPEGSSTLQVARSFEQALSGAGFETIFQCTALECAGERPPSACRLCGDWRNKFAKGIMHRMDMILSGQFSDDQRYIAARLARPEGDVYVALLVLGLQKPLVQLDVVEVEPMQGGGAQGS